MLDIKFEKATKAYHSLLLSWLNMQHVQEHWDNSPERFEDITYYLKGIKDISDYWIGFMADEPYCLLITSDCTHVSVDDFRYNHYVLANKKIFCVDLIIGNRAYLEKGFGAMTLEKFMKFIQEKIETTVGAFIFHLAQSNPQAKSVYEKAGFQIAKEFEQNNGLLKKLKYYLMVKQLSSHS